MAYNKKSSSDNWTTVSKALLVEKNKGLSIHVSISALDSSDKKIVNIREFYLKDNEWLPTQKGFTIDLELIPEFLQNLVEFFDKHIEDK